ncbi:MAG TPA: beta-propeller fold lactonase family protein [Verrucomicrobiae bacterium]|nr:beta-propeller fold lactonase family protein [Verrucomicrobiae bacterium]
MKPSILLRYFTAISLGAVVSATSLKAEDGELFTMDNGADANHVLMFQREERGGLVCERSFETGGKGTGAGLNSQGSLLLSSDGRWLFVCNAGSGEISVFSVGRDGLVLTDKVSSGGKMPLSLSFRHHLLYVLNADGSVGGKDNITGFIFFRGHLQALPGSTQGLSADDTGPAQVSFSRDGDVLIVTERVTSIIDTFTLGEDGLIAGHKTFQSVGTTPFGFDIGKQDRLFVSEAAGGAANASSASSYEVSENGDLGVLSGAVPTKQTAACWLLTSRDGHFIYTANAGSGTISGFRIEHDGSLHLLAPDGRTGVTGDGSHPVDMVESVDGRFLYSLNNGNGTLSAFRVKPNGTLDSMDAISGIPTSSAGLVGR